ncbi:MAG TPA: DinB family protein [Candidatus Baltobacteraceae bacterium]|nr:DinB family protein [Candidatus Baltobacteraceae bacterium]
MNHYGGKEMAASFRTVRKNTIQVAEDIPEEKYSFRVTPDTRTVAQTLVHIAYSPEFAFHVHGNKVTDLATVNFPELFQKITAQESRPRTKAEIIGTLRSEGERFASFLESLPDAFLAETLTTPAGASPASRTRFDMLLGVKEHEMHHRAQLMVMERLVGVVPHLTRQRQEALARAQKS